MIVNAHDENVKLIDLIQTIENGEEVFIVDKDGKTFQIVQVKPSSKYSDPRPEYGSAEGLIEMSDDFDAPLEDFKEYMLVDQPTKKTRRKAGSAKGQIRIADDFDAPIDDLDEYT